MNNSIDTAHCWSCNSDLPLADFNKDRSRANGHQSTCRVCSTAIKSEWAKGNRDRLNENYRKWYAKHKLPHLPVDVGLVATSLNHIARRIPDAKLKAELKGLVKRLVDATTCDTCDPTTA